MKKIKSDLYLIFKGLKEIHVIRPGLLLAIVVRSIVVALSPFIGIYISAQIITGIAERVSFKDLIFLALLIVILNLTAELVSSALNHLIKKQEHEFDARYEMKLNNKIISLDYTVLEDAKTHHLYQKINEFRNMNGSGIWQLFKGFGHIIQNLFTIAFSVSITLSLFVMPVIHNKDAAIEFISYPWVSAIVILSILLNVFICMYSNATVTKKNHKIMNDIIPFNRIFGYYLTSYISSYHAGKDIRIYCQKNLIQTESMKLFGDAYNVLNRLSRNQIKYSGVTTVSTVVLNTVIYLFVGLKALVGMISVGEIVKYISGINQFISGFTGFMTELATLRANNDAMKVYFEFMEIKSKMYQGCHHITKDIRSDYEIEFKNVFFRYPNTEYYVLKNINFKISGKKKTAIVGINGSGKTTIIKLLCRLYDPTEGEIMLNGINIKEYDYDEYINLFAAVFQDFKLFSFELGQNVAANTLYNEEFVKECLRKSGFSNRPINMAHGLNTALYKDFEEDGVEVSGGEAQKIAFARALYKNTPFIVLDEPTAALDPISEYEMYLRFNETVGDKTVIYISHRLSSCRFCDNIMVFRQGELVQKGNHATLVADKNGEYFKLWNSQAQYYAVD